MTDAYNKLLNAYNYIRSLTDFSPEIGIVLGSGLGNFANKIDVKLSINYNDIPEFPISTVDGHEGKFVFGFIETIPVVLMQGRVHYYEEYSISDVVMPVRLMGMMGVKNLVLTNAAGGISSNLTPGTLMAITDHISSFVPSPLIGANIDELGTRFPDMSEVYNKELTKLIIKTGDEIGVVVEKGVYLQTTGPNYETPAEIRMYGKLGADVVGMSTVCEAIAAKHSGLNICGISCVTNMAAGISKTPLSHNEVKEVADRISDEFEKLIYNLVLKIGDNF